MIFLNNAILSREILYFRFFFIFNFETLYENHKYKEYVYIDI